MKKAISKPGLILLALLLLQSSCSVLRETAPNTFTDPRDGQTYRYVRIGDQVWMAENLRYLPSASRPEIISETTPSYYVYDYYGTSVQDAKATENYQTFGVLYNWQAARIACPPGWKLPTNGDWVQLVNYIRDEYTFHNDSLDDNANGAGNALKSCRQADSPLRGGCDTNEQPRWNSHETHHGFNEFGFSALPGGLRTNYGFFSNIGAGGYWWASTEASSTVAWYRNINYKYGNVYRNQDNKLYGFSLRCIREP